MFLWNNKESSLSKLIGWILVRLFTLKREREAGTGIRSRTGVQIRISITIEAEALQISVLEPPPSAIDNCWAQIVEAYIGPDLFAVGHDWAE